MAHSKSTNSVWSSTHPQISALFSEHKQLVVIIDEVVQGIKMCLAEFAQRVEVLKHSIDVRLGTLEVRMTVSKQCKDRTQILREDERLFLETEAGSRKKYLPITAFHHHVSFTSYSGKLDFKITQRLRASLTMLKDILAREQLEGAGAIACPNLDCASSIPMIVCFRKQHSKWCRTHQNVIRPGSHECTECMECYAVEGYSWQETRDDTGNRPKEQDYYDGLDLTGEICMKMKASM